MSNFTPVLPKVQSSKSESSGTNMYDFRSYSGKTGREAFLPSPSHAK